MHTLQLLREEEGDEGSAEQVDIEDVTDAHLGVVQLAPYGRIPVVQLGKQDEVHQVQGDVQADEQQFQRRELERPLLVPQVGEQDGLEGVQGHHDGERPDIGRMLGIAHRRGDGADEGEHQADEHERGEADHPKDRGIDQFRVLALLVREAEEGRLHAVGQDDQEEGGVGVQVRDDPVAAAGRRDLVGIEGNEQVVQEPPDDAAESVDGRILGQGFHICHSNHKFTENTFVFRPFFLIL